jgi:hypothetical protein
MSKPARDDFVFAPTIKDPGQRDRLFKLLHLELLHLELVEQILLQMKGQEALAYAAEVTGFILTEANESAIDPADLALWDTACELWDSMSRAERRHWRKMTLAKLASLRREVGHLGV